MKKIQKESKSFVTMFVAIDGTEFMTESECKTYEESAHGVINARYKKLVVKSKREYDLSPMGNEDSDVEILMLKDENDINVVMQNYFHNNPHILKDKDNGSADIYDKWIDRAQSLCERALNENDYLFVGRGFDHESFWFIGTTNSLREQIDKFVAPEQADVNA